MLIARKERYYQRHGDILYACRRKGREDPCYLTTAILSETFPGSGFPLDDKWFEVFSSVLQGYDTVCPLTEEEREAAPYVVFTIEMICMAYFADIPKFEKLTDINKRILL